MQWLGELEERVATAAQQLKALRKTNAALERKVKKLDQRLVAARDERVPSTDWKKERELIRRRVQKLAENLESLLQDDSEVV